MRCRHRSPSHDCLRGVAGAVGARDVRSGSKSEDARADVADGGPGIGAGRGSNGDDVWGRGGAVRTRVSAVVVAGGPDNFNVVLQDENRKTIEILAEWIRFS